MELTGSTADRWEQMSNKITELAMGISAKQELVKGISSTLEDLNAELDAERQMLEQLANLTLKEVLREESGTLNDEAPEIPEIQKAKPDPVQKPKPKPAPQPQIPAKTPTPAQKEKPVKSQPTKKTTDAPKKPETLPLLEVADATIISPQPEGQAPQKEG